MRRWLSAVVVLFVSAMTANAQLKTATPQELGVIKVLLAQEAAWNRGDIEAFATGYKNAPDIIFIGSHVSRGHDELVNEYRKNYPNRDAMGTLGFSELEVRPLDENFAVVIGKYHLDRNKKAGGNADGIFSLVFEKTDQGWKIVVDHTT
ncbi:YybH family protein [Granulicella sibirica]|uniref:L-asparaginase n=1 Tax=Granulicella sibirica TaxID=2479048 RepID=A0A4Q0TA03_9BACT|nr:nuclear transport factor 2 family protein [Granulicella sibirica]RXH58596.1 L-asparaginase [Granulicella sibirica]